LSETTISIEKIRFSEQISPPITNVFQLKNS